MRHLQYPMAQEHTEMCVSNDHARRSGRWSLRAGVTTAFVAPMSQNRALCLLGTHVQGHPSTMRPCPPCGRSVARLESLYWAPKQTAFPRIWNGHAHRLGRWSLGTWVIAPFAIPNGPGTHRDVCFKRPCPPIGPLVA